MKKLLLMLLVIVGGAVSASATSTTIRIYAERQFSSGWGDDVYIFAGYTDASSNWHDLITNTKMSWIGNSRSSNHMFYADVTLDDDLVADAATTTNGIEFQFDDGTNWTEKKYVKQSDFLTKGHVFYIFNENGYKNSHVSFDGYAIATDKKEANKIATLSINGLTLSGTVDMSSYDADTYFRIYPEIIDTDNNNTYLVSIAPNADGEYYGLGEFKQYSYGINNGVGDIKTWKETQHLKYDISVDLSSANFTFTPYRTTTIGDAGYATWSNGEKYVIDDTNVEDVYVVTAKGDGYVTLTSKKGSTFPANEGVIIKGSGEVKINAVASDATASTIGTNYLVGNGNSSSTPDTGDNIYVFSWDGSNASTVGFYRATTGTLAAHKAYLDLTGVSGAREFLGFSFGDEPSGISEVGAKATDGAAYNLQGVRIGKLQKGINIVNGKKVMVK